MTRRERILVLLEHWQDVQPGLVDTDSMSGSGRAGGYVLLAGGCWDHRSYRELERLARELRSYSRWLYWNLAEMYFRSERRRIALCPKCGREAPPWHAGEIHRHGQRTVTLVASIVRVNGAMPHVVGQGVSWIDEHWQGDVWLPDELRGDVRPRVLLGSSPNVVTLAPKIGRSPLEERDGEAQARLG